MLMRDFNLVMLMGIAILFFGKLGEKDSDIWDTLGVVLVSVITIIPLEIGIAIGYLVQELIK